MRLNEDEAGAIEEVIVARTRTRWRGHHGIDADDRVRKVLRHIKATASRRELNHASDPGR